MFRRSMFLLTVVVALAFAAVAGATAAVQIGPLPPGPVTAVSDARRHARRPSPAARRARRDVSGARRETVNQMVLRPGRARRTSARTSSSCSRPSAKRQRRKVAYGLTNGRDDGKANASVTCTRSPFA